MKKEEVNPYHLKIMNNWNKFGYMFIQTLLVENRINYFILFKSNPDFIKETNEKNKEGIPFSEAFNQSYKDLGTNFFRDTIKDFYDSFDVPSDIKNEIEWVSIFRNAIAHSIVSGQRESFLYRPKGSDSQIERIFNAFDIPEEKRNKNGYIVLTYNGNNNYDRDYNRILKINDYLDQLADDIGVIKEKTW